MKCERCLRGEEAKFRVHTDMINMKVCVACAGDARKLGIAADPLEDQTKSESAARDCRAKSLPLLAKYHR